MSNKGKRGGLCCKKSEKVSLAAAILAPAPHWRTRGPGATGDMEGRLGGSVRMLLWVRVGQPRPLPQEAPVPPSPKVKTHTRSQHGPLILELSVVFGRFFRTLRCARTRPRCSRPADRVMLLKNQQRAPNRAPDSIPTKSEICSRPNWRCCPCPCPNQPARALKQSN